MQSIHNYHGGGGDLASYYDVSLFSVNIPYRLFIDRGVSFHGVAGKGCVSVDFEDSASGVIHSGPSQYICINRDVIDDSVVRIEKNTNCGRMLYECRSVQAFNLDLGSPLILANAFYNCSNLSTVCNINLSECKNLEGVFRGCTSLLNLPNPFDARKCTNFNNAFTSCSAVLDLPEVFMATQSVSMAALTGVSRNSLARFDGSGNIVGGMAYNLNSITEARTLTLNETLCNKFTQEEKIAIRDMITDKGWTLAGWNVN